MAKVKGEGLWESLDDWVGLEGDGELMHTLS